MKRRSIGFPLAVGITLTVLALALAVGWQILVVSDLAPVARGLTAIHWVLLILGSVFFLLLILGLVLLCAWLIREMRHNQRQQAFLDAVTHELRTPLASLHLYVETLLRHDPERNRRRDFLQRMGGDLERLDRTVEHVLAAARADEARVDGEGESVDVGALLDRSIGELATRHGLPQGAVRLELGAVRSVLGNEGDLALVFRNLLENAVKYSDPPVDVRVQVRPVADHRVEVVIADRGIGIPRKDLRKIFQRFYRAGREVQRTAAGLGLGLFIVGHLVRRQGGRVVALSEGTGRGSRFVVTLRAAAPGEAPEAARVPDGAWVDGSA